MSPTVDIPPHDQDLERAVLGVVLCEPEVAPKVLARTDPADFFIDWHRIVRARMGVMHAAGDVIDLHTLVLALREAGEYDAVGGHAALGRLFDEASIPAHVGSYIDRLIELRVKRGQLELGIRLKVLALNGTPAAAISDEATRTLTDLTETLHHEPLITVRSITESLARDPAEMLVKYIKRPEVPAQGLIALSAGPGVGKGKWTQALLACRSAGLPFMGQPLDPGPTCFLSYEQGPEEDDRVFGAICRGLGIGAADFVAPLLTISQPRRQLDDPRMMDALVKLGNQHPGLLIAIDSLRRALPGDDISSEMSNFLFRSVFQPLRATGATVLLLAHPPKPPVQGDLRVESLIRGSGDWLAILDSFLVLKPAGRQRVDPGTEEIHCTLTHVKARRGPKGEGGTFTIRVNCDNTPDIAFSFGFATGGTEITKAQVALEELASFFRERGVATRRQYLDAFVGRFSERQLDPARKTLVAQGLLRVLEEKDGNKSVWAWVEGVHEPSTVGVDGSVDSPPASDGLPF